MSKNDTQETFSSGRYPVYTGKCVCGRNAQHLTSQANPAANEYYCEPCHKSYEEPKGDGEWRDQ